MTDQLTAKDAGLAACLALTAHYFPCTDQAGRVLAPFASATLFAHRKPQAWPAWPALPAPERDLIAQVMSLLPAEWVEEKRLKAAVLDFLGALSLDDAVDADRSGGVIALAGGDPFRSDAVVLRVGGEYLEYARRVTDPFFSFGKRQRAHPFAGPGKWKTRTAYLGDKHGTTSREIEFPATGAFGSAPNHDSLPALATRPYRPVIAPTVKELTAVAKLLSQRDPSVRYLHTTLKKFLGNLRTTDGTLTALELLSGSLQVLNAPTGSGKTVLVRVAASWAAINGYRIALAVPDVRATLNMAWDISNDLAWLHQQGHLDHPGTCVPLMSPSSMHRRALDYAALTPSSSVAEWSQRSKQDLAMLSYGCAQRPLMDPPELYPYGQENCTSLTSEATGPTLHACPYIPVCGKFRQFYDATQATVVVTNHANLLDGRTRIGMVLDGQQHQGKPRGTRGVSVLETVLRGFDLIFIDEVDAFQTTAIDRCTIHMTLASRKRGSALWDIDTDSRHLPSVHEADVRAPTSHTRHMAEALLGWLAASGGLKLNPGNNADDPDGSSRDNAGWRLADSRDRELLQILFPDHAPSPEALPPELFKFLNDLMPERWHEPLTVQDNLQPPGADWDAARRALAALVAPRSENYLKEVKTALHELLLDAVPNANRRAAAVNLLLTRTVLKDLDYGLDRLREEAQNLRHLDLASVRKILESTQTSTVTALYPVATLGRSINGYQVKGMEKPETEAELLTRTFGGDPHTFVSEIGGLTSLMVAGVERPVLGLSATAFLPQAVQEHVHAPVRWWIPDTRPNSIITQPTAVYYDDDSTTERTPIRIGGIYADHKPKALRDLGKFLYEQQLAKHLAHLEETEEDRARVILTVNSYEQAAYLAAGVAQAQGLNHTVCVLVRSRSPREYEQHLPQHVQGLVREELEQFPDRGQILIAPLAVISRGLNIVVGTRSAVRNIYLCTRPVLSIEDTAWLHASVNAAGTNAIRAGGTDPLAALDGGKAASWQQLTRILRSPAQFSNMAHELQEELVAGLLVLLIQLAGRARRGETDMHLHIVDYSLHDTTFSSDLAAIIKRIYRNWTPEQRAIMDELYGQALNAFLEYAGIR